MKRQIVTAAVALTLLSTNVIAKAQQHLFDTKDAIEMSRFSNLTPSDEHTPIRFSPDGRYFVFVTSRGVLASDEIESRMWIYSSHRVGAFLHGATATAPQPRLLATARSKPEQFSYASYSSIITNVQWSNDSRSIYFLVQSHSGNRRLSRAFADGSKVRVLTPESEDVVRYVIAPKAVAYVAVDSNRQRSYVEALRGSINRDAVAPDSVDLAKILFPHQGYEPEITELWTYTQGRNRHVSKALDEKPEQVIDDPFDKALSISPDGRHMVHLRTIANIPDAWSAYEPAPNEKHLRITPGRQRDDNLLGVGFFKQFVMTDTISGRTEPLLQAPVGRYLGCAADMTSKWSPNGQFLLLTNTFLPLDQASTSSQEPVYPCLAAVVELSTRHIACLQYFAAPIGTSAILATKLQDARFVDTGVALTFGDSFRTGSTCFYRLERHQWKIASFEQASQLHSTMKQRLERNVPNANFTVQIHQGLNEPPTLEAVQKPSGRAVQLWNPNPQLLGTRWGEVSVLRWKDQNGNEWKGGLIKPVNYIPGKRYPLVIQMYAFYDGEFLTDGMSPTAMPARAIASAGMFYLQASKKPHHTWDQQEAQDHLDGVLSAIHTLDAQGLIDPHRVGIIGFSFTCWYVENELVKAPDRFAAATIADGADDSYSQYMFWGIANPQLRKQMEAINGGRPFREGLAKWMTNASAFHLDKVLAPVRIEAIRPGSLLGEWEIYASLRLQHKPVDLIYYPAGQHQLQRPLERLASAQGNVDWFRFWLQGYEDPDPTKLKQYARWERMRGDRQPGIP